MTTITMPKQTTFIKSLPDDHPAKSLEQFTLAIHMCRQPLTNVVQYLTIMNFCSTDFPWLQQISDIQNLTIPVRSFELDFISVYDNVIDLTVNDDNSFVLLIDPEELNIGYSNYIQSVEYRYELLNYVFRLYYYDYFEYPNIIIGHLNQFRAILAPNRSPLHVLQFETRILEHLAMFPEDIVYSLRLFIQNPEFLMPLASAVTSDKCAWKFPPYKCIERYKCFVDSLLDEPPEDEEDTYIEYEASNYSDENLIDYFYEDILLYECDYLLRYSTSLIDDYFDPYVGLNLLFMSEYELYLHVHARRLNAWCDTNIVPLEFVSLYEEAVPQMHIPGLSSLTSGVENCRNTVQNLADGIPIIKETVEDFGNKLPDKDEREKWAGVFAQLGSSLDNTSNIFAQFTSLTSILPGFEKAKSFSEEFKEKFKNTSIGDNSSALFMCMFAALLNYLRYRTWTGLSLFTVFWVPLALSNNEHFKNTLHFWAFIAMNLPESVDSEDDIATPQMSNSDMEGAVELISSMFLGHLAIKKTKTTEDAIVSFLKDFTKIRGGAVAVSKSAFNLAEKLINIGMEQATGDNPMFKFFSTSYVLYDEYFAEVRSFCSKYNNKQVHASAETLSTVAYLIEVGRKIKLGLPKDDSTKDISTFITQDLQSLRKIQTSLEQQNIAFTGFRNEPVCVEIKGPTNIAKSVVITNLNYAAVARHFSGKELAAFVTQPSTKVFSVIPENEYLDGFKQCHWVANFDDFGQSRDAVGNPDNEYMKLIRFINGFEYYPHMAELENKGTVTFRAAYVFLSTNVRHHNPVSLAKPEAFRRRIHFSYLASPKLEYTDKATLDLDLWHRKLDTSLLPVDSISGKTIIDDSIHDFYVLDSDSSEPTGEIIGFNEVVERMFKRYDNHKDYFEQNLKTFHATIDKYHDLYHPSIPISDEDCQMEDVVNDEYVIPTTSIGSYQQVIGKYLTHIRARSLITHYLPELDYDPLTLIHSLDVIELRLLEAGIDENKFRLLIEDVTQRILPVYSVVKFRKKCSIFVRIYDYIIEKFPILLRIKNFIMENGVEIVTRLICFMITFKFLTWVQKLICKIFCSREKYDELYPQSHNEGDKMRMQKSAPKLYKSSHAMKSFLSSHPATNPQMGSDANGQDIIASIVNSNHFALSKENFTYVKDAEGNEKEIVTWDHLGHFLVVRERVALMNYHYLIALSRDVMTYPERLNIRLKITRNGKSRSEVSHIFTVREILERFEFFKPDSDDEDDIIISNLVKKDLILLELPKQVQPCRDITEYIISEKLLAKDSLTIEGLIANAKKSFFAWTTILDRPVHVIDDHNKESWFLREGYRYHAITVSGDCGSIFAKMDSSVQKQKIYGLHSSGGRSANFGYASPFTQEEIRKALERFYPLVIEADPQIEWLNDMNFIVQGPIANPPVVPTKSAIMKSPIFDEVKLHTTIPCHLFAFTKDGEVIDPWYNAISKYDHAPFDLTEQVLSQVERAANQYFFMLNDTMIRRYTPRVFTLEEAIHGVENDEFFGPVPSGTSAGYPMNVQGNENLKKLLFASDRNSPEYLSIFERIREEVELAECTYATGGRPEFFYVDYLKDERKKIEKVYQGKTCMFSGGPAILFFLFRKHFGWFDSHFKSNKIRNWSAIGVNPFSSEWDHIAKFLGEVSPGDLKALAGDYAGFDTKHIALVHQIMVNLIIRVFYPNATPREIAIKKGLFMEIYSSNHIFLGIIVRWFQGMPSGNALTAIINTIYNAICLCFAFIHIIDLNPQLQLRDEDCTKSLRAIILGDDNAVTTIPKLQPYYNEFTLPDILKLINMDYTNELKALAKTPYRAITEISFLKRMWSFDPMCGRYIAPLELDVVLEMSMWTKKGPDWLNIAASNLENTLNELSLHPKEIWDLYYPTLLKAACREYSFFSWVLPLLTPWDVRRQRVLETISFY